MMILNRLFGIPEIVRIKQIGSASFRSSAYPDGTWVAVQRNYYKRCRLPLGMWGKPYVITPDEFEGTPCCIDVYLDHAHLHRLGINVIDDSTDTDYEEE